MDRDFKGVWIPKEIWLNEDLGWTEKLLLVEIDSLARNGECFATNEYLAKFLGVSKDRISKLITALNRKGLLSVELIYKTGTKVIEKRILTPLGIYADTSRRKHLYPLGENCDTPIGENAYDNNTVITNTPNNTISNKKTSKKKSVPNSEYEAEFETLWAMYPKKQGKKLALSQYIKARKTKKYTYETIKLGLEMYIRHLEQEGTDDKFIKAGKTWFNEGWLDEYSPSPLNRKPKSLNEYLRQKHGGAEHEQVRDRKIVDLYPQNLPEPFQGF